jgi:hypothetical protein
MPAHKPPPVLKGTAFSSAQKYREFGGAALKLCDKAFFR